MNTTHPNLSELETCLRTLEALSIHPERLASLSAEDKIRLLKSAGKLVAPTPAEKKERRQAMRAQQKEILRHKDHQQREHTGIRSARKQTVFQAPLQLPMNRNEAEDDPAILTSGRNCYICKTPFTELHHFYDALCKPCAEFNYLKRFQTAPLHGKVALITGSRVKIGYQATLMLLRAGATVIATTRFPVDSASRFSKEDDFSQWQDRLHVFGLDLRHIPSVELFTQFIISHYPRLDILINNAAQTVRRPPGFYAHLMSEELRPFNQLPEDIHPLLHQFNDCRHTLEHSVSDDSTTNLPVQWHQQSAVTGITSSAAMSQIPYSFDAGLPSEEYFPQGKLDADLQQVDLRKTNSWRLKLGEIEPAEMVEVQLVNAIAPFVLCNRLIPLMKKDVTGQKHIVNVTAMEGKFHRFKKYSRHPHTNMAKAALNMLTHTGAADLEAHGIYMNAVDTGWVTDEDPADLAKFKAEVHDFAPPLDIVDGAARVCDPFFDGILTGKHWVGKFLKDYFPIDW